LQRTKNKFESPRGIATKEEFYDNKVEHLRSLQKQERDEILTLELKKILWELLIPPEYFLTLYQKELDDTTFTIEKYQYRRRKNLLVIYRGLQFLIEQKFEILLNIGITKNIIFPTLKEMVMEEYLSDITNDMIVCLIRAGSVIIRSEIWKFFLTARDGYTREVIKSSSKRNKKNESDDSAFQDEALPSEKRKQNKGFSKTATNFKTKKEAKKSRIVKGKAKLDVKKESAEFKTNFESESNLEKAKAINVTRENKLVTTKPWFSKSEILKPENEAWKRIPNLCPVCLMVFVLTKNHPSMHPVIYDTTDDVNANNT
jgi:hypothetical protein